MKNNVYILSTGRSGTTFISNLFKQLDNDFEIEHQKKGSRIINIVANSPFNTPKILWFLLNVLKRRDSNKPESTADPLLSFAIYKLIEKGYFNGKIVHLVRNPESFVNSFMRWKNQSLRKKILHNLIPFWNPNPFLFDPKIKLNHWLYMSNFDKFCWAWYYKNKKYHSLKDFPGVEYLLIRMEDLTSEDGNIRKKELQKLGNFLELEWNNEEIENLDFSKINESGTSSGKRKITPPARKERLKYYCEGLAKEFGYKL